MGDYELDRRIKSIKQSYLPGLEERETTEDRRLVFERTIADFWETDTFSVVSQIRKFFIAGYSDEEHCLLQGAWSWVQRGGLLKVEEEAGLDLPLEVLLNMDTVFFWTVMREELSDPGLGDFPIACRVDTNVWREDVRAICGECLHRLRTVTTGELHKRVSVSERIGTIAKIEESHGSFHGLMNEAIVRAKEVDSITYTLIFDYYMTLIKRGKQLLEIYRGFNLV